jgi:hypothetical protein
MAVVANPIPPGVLPINFSIAIAPLNFPIRSYRDYLSVL